MRAETEDRKIDPRCFASALRGLNAIGGAISRDIKHGILPHLDAMDPLAAAVKSVNTVVKGPDGLLTGYNTDAHGFREAIAAGVANIEPPVKTAVVYGYGGVFSVVSR